jgi:hypothetical protein
MEEYIIMEETYTHNLKILLIDNNNIIEDKVVLDEIKSILTKNNTNIIEWNGQLRDFTIKWDKKNLNEINKSFMGDLFSNPIYDFDRIIQNHTQQTISKINCKYIIKFYISRIICDKKISKNTVGLI